MSGKKEKKAAPVQKQEEEEEAPELINAEEEEEHVHGEHCDHDHDDFSSDDEGEVTDPQELLLQMLYDCEEADDVEEYINILETTLLAAKGRQYQLKLEESKPKEQETNANQSPASQVLTKLKDNLTVDCLHQEHNEATQEETIMLTLRISALPSLEEEAAAEDDEDEDAPKPIDAILWWHYDSLTSEVVDEDGPPNSTSDVEVDIRFRLAWATDGDDPETAQQLISFDTSSDDPQEQNPSNLKANREQVRLLLEFLLQRRSKDEKALATAGGLQTNFWNLIVSYIAPALHSAKHQKALAQQLRQAFIAASGGASSSSSSSGKQQKKPAEAQGQKRKAEGGAAGQQPAKKQQQGQQGKGQQQQQKQKGQQQQQGGKKNKNKGGKH